MPFELIRSEPLVNGRAFKIRRDTLRTPDGRETRLEIVDHGGSVVVIPVDEKHNILFVKQYRHAAKADLLELPAGTRDGEEPYEECAAREVREETGMAAGRLQKLGTFYLAPGYSTEFMAVFLATELRDDPLQADDDEFLQVERIPARQALEMAAQGDLQDAKSLAGLLLARAHLEKYFI
ncbi:MAG: NUDIX hydrolase [Chloroflexota bacterium]|nr:NUDIX hydrolase [Chloroflexota bacterium]